MKLKAFTLVELMVVMAIIAFLSVGAYGGLTYALRQGRDTQRMRITDQIQTAMQAYYADWQGYPGCAGATTVTGTGLTQTIKTCSGAFSSIAGSFVNTKATGGSPYPDGLADYFESEFTWGPFAKDLSVDKDLKYFFEPKGSTNNGIKFTVCATMENPRGGNIKTSKATATNTNKGCYCVGANQSGIACIGM